MKTYDEIKDIMVNKLGLKDMAAYVEWVKTYDNADHTQRKLISQADIDLLSPDVVNCHDFWKVADEVFGIDPVCATLYGKSPVNIDSGNMRNLGLARLMGALNFVDEWRHYKMPLLEIGVGYGMFKNYCMLNTAFSYCGFDVVARVPGVNLVNPDGTLPQQYLDDMKDKVMIAYSSNVFQHFSNRQRSQYFKDIHSVLHPDGVFVFNCLVHYYDPAIVKVEDKFAEDNRRYLKHYGQFTEIPYYPELLKELGQWFNLVYETRRAWDGFYTFSLGKKNLTPPQVAATVVTS